MVSQKEIKEKMKGAEEGKWYDTCSRGDACTEVCDANAVQ